MVKGIEKFKEYFADFSDNYVIIGGTACDIHEELNAQTPRATKDLDIVLIIEALSTEFVAKFWEFIVSGQYGDKNRGEGIESHQEYYRFKRPLNPDYPYQIELFARNIGLINFPDEAHITPIPTDEDLSSLSAILMDDEYYNYTISHSQVIDGVHIADIDSLICLKARAYVDLILRKEQGENVDSRNIEKHKKDVLRLVAMQPDDNIVLPDSLKEHLLEFSDLIATNLPDQNFIKSIGLPPSFTPSQLLMQLTKNFNL
jgi:hypothetical protein